MNAAINICKINLVESKTLPTFVMPRNDNDYQSNRYISFRSIKAGFLSDNSTSVVLRFLAETEWRLASFYISINQIFGQKTMPRNDKNLTVDTQVVSASTPRTRKSTPISAPSAQSTPLTPICRYSELKAHELQAELRKAKAATSVAESATKAAAVATAKRPFKVTIYSEYRKFDGNPSHYYTTAEIYHALSMQEALGMAFEQELKDHPNCVVTGGRCTRLNAPSI